MCFRSVCNYCQNLDQVPNVILDQIPQKELDQSTVDPLCIQCHRYRIAKEVVICVGQTGVKAY